jgi:hypothetical protein
MKAMAVIVIVLIIINDKKITMIIMFNEDGEDAVMTFN